jgi:hypothetical protein
MTKKTRGVLAIAADHADYGRMAINLARSIRLRDPQLPLAIATNLDPNQFRGIYDYVVPWKFDRWPGLLSKLQAPEMSPFDDTLFLDVDLLVYGSLEPLFEVLAGNFFCAFGSELKPNRWFKRMAPIRAVVPGAGRLSLIGAAYYFEKGPAADAVYERARKWNARYEELEIRTYRASRNEEPLFAMAMYEAGLDAPEIQTQTSAVNLCLPSVGFFEANVITGRAIRCENGAEVNQLFMHFGGDWKTSYEYLQEEMRLQMHAARRGRSGLFGTLRSLWSLGEYFVQSPRRMLRLHAALSLVRRHLS